MSKRIVQVNELLRKELAMIIERELEFPDVLVTVTRVDCSPDLRQAKIWVSVLPDSKMGSVIESLRKQAGFIARLLRTQVVLRSIPRLNFVIDDTEKQAAEIEEVLKEIKREN